jgi:hypothetical protein
MNGMERKVAERSATLECKGEKRKPPAAGFGRKTIHGLHIRRVVGPFVVFPETMLIIKIPITYQIRRGLIFLRMFFVCGLGNYHYDIDTGKN